ncbi:MULTISPECIES: NCS2 family permease [unclassified Bacillus (in: firmicutes)]|uniref:NCS2 family permease n=1 Tax=unclassified Bacillus (in: firmicutes) TaxID=185979 RepID=UPI0008E36CEA|nr:MULTISPECIES: NCS2 family permease [unclassified Bacillus (in: firmicutes)]SFB02404.1 putative MFS transporter, AGZA family, xanthine/uracil permease [Bacillus sp. UNCCL13]SFQ89098.1 putative MFS transporter, AGZA family, xanthine/uracil permease [Bacillus sp. cl95]
MADMPKSQNKSFLNSFFELEKRQTNVKTEILAGVTTFITMSYIILVNPQILADAGVPKEAALAATIFASVIATLLMALWANFPVAVAPGMGLNAFFAYTVVLGQGLSWQTALGAVFISGIVFLILTVTGVRKKIVDGVPAVLKSAIGVGIGLFIAFIGFKNAGLVINSEATSVALGDLTQKGPLLALFGLLVAAFLMAKNVKGSLLISVLITTIAAMVVGFIEYPKSVSDIFSLQLPSVSETLFAMDIKGAIAYGVFSVIFSFTIVELFDNLATLIGLSKKAGLMDKAGNIENLDRALQADAVATMASASLGSTAMNAYIENATGISEGGRTGLSALTVGVLFLLSLLFAPLIFLVPSVATAPILIIVGALMLSEIKHISFDDYTDVIPVFLTIILMPLTYSIAQGLAFGFISYTLLKLLTGKRDQLHWIMYFITIAFVIHFIVGGH